MTNLTLMLILAAAASSLLTIYAVACDFREELRSPPFC
jgi:hypothetical protein